MPSPYLTCRVDTRPGRTRYDFEATLSPGLVDCVREALARAAKADGRRYVEPRLEKRAPNVHILARGATLAEIAAIFNALVETPPLVELIEHEREQARRRERDLVRFKSI